MKKLIRLKSVLERLNKQLILGTKPEKIDGRTTTNKVSLSERDRERISKEIVRVNIHIAKLM